MELWHSLGLPATKPWEDPISRAVRNVCRPTTDPDWDPALLRGCFLGAVKVPPRAQVCLVGGIEVRVAYHFLPIVLVRHLSESRSNG